MTYRIGIAVCDDVVALCVVRNGLQHILRWRHGAAHAHEAALQAIERARALRVQHDEPRVIYLRQRSVVDMLRSPDLVWSSARSPHGEHPTVQIAFDAAARAAD